MGPLTTAREYFQQFTAADAYDVITKLPTSSPKTFENEWLDFKSGRTQETDIARIWSKSLGAFSNNEGGVVVWGVSARKDPHTGIDAASDIELVPNCDQLRILLVEQARFATDPPLQGIETVCVHRAAKQTDGFVVCFIPEGTQKPYRSEKSERRFYLRIGDESKEPTVGLLRQLFYPKYDVRLRLEIRKKHCGLNIGLLGSSTRDNTKAGYEVKVRNIGELSVHDLAIAITCETCELFDWHFQKFGDERIHIESLDPVKHLVRTLHPQLAGVVNVVAAKEGEMDNPNWTFKVYARDMQPLVATVSQHTLARTINNEQKFELFLQK